jgi:molybdenum cofactor synthesis domain-containing protein
MMNRPDMKRFPKRGNPIEAQATLVEALSSIKLQTEVIGLQQAVGRVLGKDVFSTINIPGYDKTFIDGYAIRPNDTSEASIAKPATFKVVGKLFPADYPTAIDVGIGEAVYVACGAPIPNGASATVKVEETRLKDDTIEVVRAIQDGEGVIPLGDDVKQGELIIPQGQVLRPQDVGLLAQVGLAEAEIYKKPRIAILSGGDELIKESQKTPRKIVNNYSLVVAQLAIELGADAELKGIMADSLEQVEARISQALFEADVVVTIGGTSMGIKDFVPDAINILGKPGVVVQGIALRPGAVSGFGIVNGKPIIMLPGHIGSCIAGFYHFVAPTIRVLSGAQRNTCLPTLSAELSESVDSGPQFKFLMLNIKRDDTGFVAKPVEGGSSALSTIVKANGYALIPPHTTLAKANKVTVYLFSKLELAEIA